MTDATPLRPPAESLALAWSPLAFAWTARMDRLHPGGDHWPIASLALHRAAETFDPGKGACFATWFRRSLEFDWSVARRVERRRKVFRITRIFRRSARPAGSISSKEDPGFAAIDRRDELRNRLIPALHAALADLPPRRADWIVRHHAFDEPAPSIAASAGCSRAFVSAEIARGIDRLRERLAGVG